MEIFYLILIIIAELLILGWQTKSHGKNYRKN